MEIGSGNGRDAIYFASFKNNVIALDQSTAAIDIEMDGLSEELCQYLHPRALDFVKEEYSGYENIDVFYSRFSIHSITKNDEVILLTKIYNALGSGGMFCIEVRSTNDPLYGIGERCDNDTYIYNSHKRRFINSQIFLNQCLTIGFKLLYFTEENNLSVYKDDNPVLMRIILKKQ